MLVQYNVVPGKAHRQAVIYPCCLHSLHGYMELNVKYVMFMMLNPTAPGPSALALLVRSDMGKDFLLV
jgi:hypothetical protein